MFNETVEFIKKLYPNQNPVPLHAPVFWGNEKEYLQDCIDSTFVSYVGKYVKEFEERTAEFTAAKYAVAVVNGTAALQIALQIAGVQPGDEVITQAMTFVATANAISHCHAKPLFIDVDRNSLGLSLEKLEDFLKKGTIQKNSCCINKKTAAKITAIVPMHTFGFTCQIDNITQLAEKYNIKVIEDAAESLGSYYKNKHSGTFGLAGILSYNGNKTITTGGGGMILTNDSDFAKKARHITTTAKQAHKYEYIHDQVAYNYRMSNVSAAIGVAQMEKIDVYLKNKRETALLYKDYFEDKKMDFFTESKDSKVNYWLNTLILDNEEEKTAFLEYTNNKGIMTRPVWRLMNKLDMYKDFQCEDISNAEWLEARIVNLPSGVRNPL